MENSSRTYIPEIDILRAVAFILVTIVHFSVPTWTDGIVKPHLIAKIVLSIISTGWIGVPLFLFLSGYSLAINKTAASYQLPIKQFYTNRVLRIFPVWIACILITKWANNLSGAEFLSLLALNVQDLPASTSFSIAWSIQLEFFCYFLFPMFLSYLSDKRQLLLIFATLLSFRVLLMNSPTMQLFNLAYSTVFGCGTLFLSGMLLRKAIEEQNQITDKLRRFAAPIMGLGIVLCICLLRFIAAKGGYQKASGIGMTVFFGFLPELYSILFVMITGPYFMRGLSRIKMSWLDKILAHIGRVSYSAYMFSLFVMNFLQALFFHYGVLNPGGWIPFIPDFLCYFVVLIGFATLTYFTIEKPFLRKRRAY